MTTIKTTINGQPFEVTVADGLQVEFSEGKLQVSKPAPYNGLLEYQHPLSAALQQQAPSNGTIWTNPYRTQS